LDIDRESIRARGQQELSAAGALEQRPLLMAQMKSALELGCLSRSLRTEEEDRRIGGDDRSGVRAEQVAGILSREHVRVTMWYIMTTATYARLSLDRHDDHQAVDRQMAAMRPLAPEAIPFEDNDKSAWKRDGKRPQYLALLEAVKAGTVTAIVVWHVDRLYRQPREAENDLLYLAEHGRPVKIVSVISGTYDLAVSDGKMMFRQLINSASYESDRKSERVKAAKQQTRAKGLPTGGPRAFGWKKDGMTPEPKEAKAIIEAVKSLFAGQSLKDVAREWNAQGLKRTMHKAHPDSLWSADAIRRTVSNPRHAGLLAHDVKRKGSYQRTVIGKATWPAIIEPERWQSLMALLESRGHAHVMPKRRSLLTRLVICGKCGTVMSRTKIKKMVCYRCPSPRPEQPKDAKSCGSVSVSAQFLEEHLIEATLQRADTGELAKLVRAQAKDEKSSAGTFERMEALDHRLDKLGTMYADGEISDRAFIAANTKIRSDKEALQKQLAKATTTSVLAPYASSKGALREAWPTLTQDQQREIISVIIGPVRIMPTAMRGRHVFDRKRVQIAKR
jgi:site-specific DNA recombinase